MFLVVVVAAACQVGIRFDQIYILVVLIMCRHLGDVKVFCVVGNVGRNRFDLHESDIKWVAE